VAEEIAAILRPVAKPLEITAFPRPHVVLVIGVNGSGKTTTIAKLAHLFQEQDYGVMLAAATRSAPPRSASSRYGRRCPWSPAPRRRPRLDRVRRGQGGDRYGHRR
jgi:energy-coupling factor transporter ATP-binding protein EcfA2